MTSHVFDEGPVNAAPRRAHHSRNNDIFGIYERQFHNNQPAMTPQPQYPVEPEYEKPIFLRNESEQQAINMEPVMESRRDYEPVSHESASYMSSMTSPRTTSSRRRDSMAEIFSQYESPVSTSAPYTPTESSSSRYSRRTSRQNSDANMSMEQNHKEAEQAFMENKRRQTRSSVFASDMEYSPVSTAKRYDYSDIFHTRDSDAYRQPRNSGSGRVHNSSQIIFG